MQNGHFIQDVSFPQQSAQQGVAIQGLPIQGQNLGLNQNLIGQNQLLQQGQLLGLNQGQLGQGLPLQGQNLGLNQDFIGGNQFLQQGQPLGLNQGQLGQGLSLQEQNLSLNQGFIGGNQFLQQGQPLGLNQGQLGQGLPLQGQNLGLNQDFIGGNQFLQQGQPLGLNQGLLQQELPLQGQSFGQGLISQSQTAFVNQDQSGLPLQEMAKQHVFGSANGDLSGIQPQLTQGFNVDNSSVLNSGLAKQHVSGSVNGDLSGIQPQLMQDFNVDNSSVLNSGLAKQHVSGSANDGLSDIQPQLTQDFNVDNSSVLNSGLAAPKHLAPENLASSEQPEDHIQTPPGAQETITSATGVNTDKVVQSGSNLSNLATAEDFEDTPAAHKGLHSLYEPAQIKNSTTTVENMVQSIPDTSSGVAPELVAATKPVNVDTHSKGRFIFKPIEGKFVSDNDLVSKMEPYCKVKLGHHTGKTSVAKNEGLHRVWDDVITLEKKHNEEVAKIQVKDNDKITFIDSIGETEISLSEVVSKGTVSQWYPIFKKEKKTGEILVDVTFQSL